MDNDHAVIVEHVSKKYCKSLKRSMIYGMHDIGRNLLGLSSNSHLLRKDEFLAVDDVSFRLKKGETLGIVGVNGSGKSTLLKMLNGIFWPDKGKITIKGKVGALIEVGAGFHPSLTGRENIYINAAILGMSRREVDAKLNDIVAFADMDEFIDVPVKHYSSGMFVRLGFSVAIHCEPDVLVVDEVLAVGDSHFIEKCQERIRQLLEKGVTLILVSHNLRLIATMCSRGILVHNGKQLMDGDMNEVIRRYEDLTSSQSGIMAVPAPAHENGVKCRINNQHVTDESGKSLASYPIGSRVRYSFDYSLHPSVDLDRVSFSVGLLKEQERYHVARYLNTMNGFRLKHREGRLEFLIDVNVTSGNYMFDVNFSDESILPLDVQFSPRFRVFHPCFPKVDKECFGQFLLEPQIKFYPLNPQSDLHHKDTKIQF